MVVKPYPAVADRAWDHRDARRGGRSLVQSLGSVSSPLQNRMGNRRSTAPGIKMPHSDQILPLPQSLEGQVSDLPIAAEEFGISSPSDSLVGEVRRIAWKLRAQATREFSLYLMPDGAVAVDIRGKRPDGVFIRIKEEGSAHCSGELEGKVWRKPYSSSRDIPDDSLLDELYRLRSKASEQ